MKKISRGDAECFSHLQIFMSLTVFSARAFPATEIVFVSRSNGAILFRAALDDRCLLGFGSGVSWRGISLMLDANFEAVKNRKLKGRVTRNSAHGGGGAEFKLKFFPAL
jgi:hypothetical protein